MTAWRDLPETYGPRTTCYNRFVRWRRAGVWDQIIDALAAGHDAAVQMIDTSVVRVHQHGACIADNNHQDMGRSRGGLTSKDSRGRRAKAARHGNKVVTGITVVVFGFSNFSPPA
jgi:Putative transposase of IS4/5 family (DUF4096)